MSLEYIIPLFIAVVVAATPLLLAATGELIVERSGVLNLGIEGMMLVGAISAFAIASQSGSLTLGVFAGMGAGALLSLIFAFLVLSLKANQVAIGLATTIFGIGFSALIGKGFVGYSIAPIGKITIPFLSDIPILGGLLFNHDPIAYLSIILIILVWYILYKTHWGLSLRAIGESHDSAHAVGLSVLGYRYIAVMIGGAFAGLGGAYLSLAVSPLWSENITAGRGWIALALVVFSAWRPGRLLIGAYLFGGISMLQLYSQGSGLGIPTSITAMLPYLATIAVLVLLSRRGGILNAPASLGKTFNLSR